MHVRLAVRLSLSAFFSVVSLFIFHSPFLLCSLSFFALSLKHLLSRTQSLSRFYLSRVYLALFLSLRSFEKYKEEYLLKLSQNINPDGVTGPGHRTESKEVVLQKSLFFSNILSCSLYLSLFTNFLFISHSHSL